MQKDVYAVIGSPVAHSLSPLIHETLYERYHIPAVYLPIELQKENVAVFFKDYAKALNLKGVNVTMPLKEEVLPLLDHLDSASSFLQSVNTIDLKTSTGYTTDGSGFVASLKTSGFTLSGKQVVMIGCGAAGRSIAYALCRQDIASLTLLNRTEEKAKALAKRLGAPNTSGRALSALESCMEHCDLLINTTNLGMAGSQDFNDLSFLEKAKTTCHVYDIVYHPKETQLLKRAKALGLTRQNGLSMLIHQAFDAFTLWFSLSPNQDDLKKVQYIIERELH